MPGNDAFTKLLLHCDGTNGSTTFTDASIAAQGNATVNGNAQVSTAQFKFGTGSALLDGAGDYLTFANSADWEFGSGDFTIDWWEYRLDSAVNLVAIVRDSTTTAFQSFLAGYANGAGVLEFYASNSNAAWDVVSTLSLGSLVASVWSHRAVVRSGDNFYGFKDGILQSTKVALSPAISIGISPGPLSIGNWNYTAIGGPFYFNGYMDEIRISKGIARWTSNFVVPTSPYDSYSWFGLTDEIPTQKMWRKPTPMPYRSR